MANSDQWLYQNELQWVFERQSRKAGCGMCLRNHLGEVLAFKCLSLPSSMNNTAEALELLYGLVLANNLELKVIHIEGDSTLIINSCIKRQIIN